MISGKTENLLKNKHFEPSPSITDFVVTPKVVFNKSENPDKVKIGNYFFMSLVEAPLYMELADLESKIWEFDFLPKTKNIDYLTRSGISMDNLFLYKKGPFYDISESNIVPYTEKHKVLFYLLLSHLKIIDLHNCNKIDLLSAEFIGNYTNITMAKNLQHLGYRKYSTYSDLNSSNNTSQVKMFTKPEVIIDNLPEITRLFKLLIKRYPSLKNLDTSNSNI